MHDRQSGSGQASPPEESVHGRITTLSAQDREELERFRRAHETQVLTIFFSDLVGSTQLQTELGNLQAAALVRKHYAIVRDVLCRFDGREIKTAGDSMLIVFAAPSEAVKFALHAQQAMRSETEKEPQLSAVRAGVHQGQVVLEKKGSGEAQRGLSVGYDKLGSVYLRLGRPAEALDAYQASLRIARSMWAKEPANMQLQRDVSVAIDRLGDVQLELDRPADALASFQQARDMAERLAQGDPGNASAQFDLLAGHVKVGDALVAAQRAQDALTNYGPALEIARRLVTADPNDAQAERSLSVILG